MTIAITPAQSVLASKVLLLIAAIEKMCDLTIEARAALEGCTESSGSTDIATFCLAMERLAAHHLVMNKAHTVAQETFRDVEEGIGEQVVTFKPSHGHAREIRSKCATWYNFRDFITERSSAIGEREALHAELRKRMSSVFEEIDALTPHRQAIRLFGAWNPQHCSGSFLEDKRITDDLLRARRSPYT